MKIGTVDTDKRVLVIAEIGNNHEGDPQRAKELVAAALEAGADAVKFQVIEPERLVNASQRERVTQLTRFKLPFETLAELAQQARARGAIFAASAFDPELLARVAPLLDAVKIASGDLDYHGLLRAASGLGKPMLLSTGMSTMDEIRDAVSVIEQSLPPGAVLADRLALLHCVSLYPTPQDQANLRAIATLRDAFGLATGYSDHTLGIECAVAAAALGARIIEKHFTLDKSQAGFRDHALSADPQDLRRLCDLAHSMQGMLGAGDRILNDAEQQMANAARRSLVFARDLPAGHRLVADDIDCVRPRNGMRPAVAVAVIGRTLRAAVKRHDLVQEGQLA